jgi:putative transport protein
LRPFRAQRDDALDALGKPAIPACSNKFAPTDRPDIGYATIFPGMTIVKILFVDIIPALF